MGVFMSGGLVRVVENSVPWLNTLTMHLYINDRVPTQFDVLGDYTEATFPGYAAQTMTSWGPAFLNAEFQGEANDVLHTFTATSEPVSPESVYGTYWTDPSANLVRAERRPAGPVEIHAGTQFSVQPRVTERNAPPC